MTPDPVIAPAFELTGVMTADQLIEALEPSRLPDAMSRIAWDEILALAGIGLLASVLIAALLGPMLVRRPSRRALIRATRGQPAQARILAISRILGRLPPALRPAAYGAAPPPPDAEIEAIALKDRGG